MYIYIYTQVAGHSVRGLFCMLVFEFGTMLQCYVPRRPETSQRIRAFTHVSGYLICVTSDGSNLTVFSDPIGNCICPQGVAHEVDKKKDKLLRRAFVANTSSNFVYAVAVPK